MGPFVRQSVTAFVIVLSSLLPAITFAADDETGGPAIERLEPTVVGGAQAPLGKWPDTAAVYFGDSPGCTGVLVAPNVVLTAGHCIDGITQVKLGVNDYRDPGEVLRVIKEVAHPNWWRSYDIGLLVLERDASIEPRVIATGCVNDSYLDNGSSVAIVGYGAINEQGNEQTTMLMEAATTITDFDCTGGRGCNGGVSPGGELGAGGMGIDSCFGDSGGPLYLTTPIGDFLIGITSRAYNDVGLPCAEGGIYTRPDSVIDWIEQETGQTIPLATCNLGPSASIEDITVEAGKIHDVDVDVTDPDQQEGHTIVIIGQPDIGEATVDSDGQLLYRAPKDYEGVDMFTVRVSDSGVPSLSVDVMVQVTVIPEQGCGCTTRTGDSSGVWLVLLAIALSTRRRRPTAAERR